MGLTGPRQSGKTTLLKAMFSDYRYVSLENIDQKYVVKHIFCCTFASIRMAGELFGFIFRLSHT
ncbi:MAG: AAA family ATPase [Proteiniphilum sp.]|nr:AAA family ATPase [Proteiniphilum sp.]MDD3969461.1 AAA family ATPase [Proteiniphilum sp.]MDD4459274.1 AAA family ATPase [Proteiniphilum sp.]